MGAIEDGARLYRQMHGTEPVPEKKQPTAQQIAAAEAEEKATAEKSRAAYQRGRDLYREQFERNTGRPHGTPPPPVPGLAV